MRSHKEARGVFNWQEVVLEAAAIKASDVFWKANAHPHVRVQGKIHRWEQYPVVGPETTVAMAQELMTERQWELFEEFPERDLGLTIGESCRLRINVFKQQNTVGLVMRIIPLDILTVEQLELPSVLLDIAMSPQGVVLVTGPTGCGKSTSLAAMIHHINLIARPISLPSRTLSVRASRPQEHCEPARGRDRHDELPGRDEV